MKLCAKRIMNHAPRPTARPSRARIAVCTSNGKCVPGRKLVSGTHNSVIYQSLRSLCTSCTSCTSFSEFILGLLKNTVLFSKKNFNLKLPYTLYTHLYSPRVYSLYTLSNRTHMCTHTVHTLPCSVHTTRI